MSSRAAPQAPGQTRAAPQLVRKRRPGSSGETEAGACVRQGGDSPVRSRKVFLVVQVTGHRGTNSEECLQFSAQPSSVRESPHLLSSPLQTAVWDTRLLGSAQRLFCCFNFRSFEDRMGRDVSVPAPAPCQSGSVYVILTTAHRFRLQESGVSSAFQY